MISAVKRTFIGYYYFFGSPFYDTLIGVTEFHKLEFPARSKDDVSRIAAILFWIGRFEFTLIIFWHVVINIK
jgi:hypothetical protein